MGILWEEEQFPYHYKRIPNDGVIDPDWPDDKVERFIRAMYFPPLTPAKFRSADGELHPVVSLAAFEALRRGEAPAPPPAPALPVPANAPPPAPAPQPVVPPSASKAEVGHAMPRHATPCHASTA
ncbi:mask [Symbiodinium natans]|uniref:Mask protein n=1 Tax=Symbiodinium natans TaxID=878477 RepID=A0A812RBT4_9DINO|nr:mask [Symbiodinium natans]